MSTETITYDRAECHAEPKHVATYFEHDPDAYPGPCMYCAYSNLAEAHRGCEHSHHKAWRRWKITGWLAGQLYATGITSNGGSWRMGGGGCDGCRTMPRWNRNRRVYVLWVRTDHWRCLLKQRHTPGDPIGLGLCSKCLPCPDCGSKTAGHKTGCE